MTLHIGKPHIPSRCGADFPNGCVEVTQLEDGVRVRDTKLRGSSVENQALWYTYAEWDAFVTAVKAGEYDPAPA